MARLNSRQKRAAKLRAALHALALAANPSTVAQTGCIRSSTMAFSGSVHKAPAGTYKVAAVRPTIVTARKKSGAVERLQPGDVMPSGVVHVRDVKACVPSQLPVRVIDGKVKPKTLKRFS